MAQAGNWFLSVWVAWVSISALGFSREIQPIEILTRGAGDFVDGNTVVPQRTAMQSFDPKTFVSVRLTDIQYRMKKSYQGVRLLPLILEHAGSSSLVLLHFDNGMIIPIPLDQDGAALKKIDPFLAFAVKSDSGQWSPNFPALAKKSDDARYSDPRPLRFGDNKLVVTSPWHPFAPREGSAGFSPWTYAGSLIRIEFADREAYYRQFEVATTAEFNGGMKVFLERCQYCHGARLIGASYGWDFVTPLATYKQKPAEQLFNHVKFPKWDALTRGLMMPRQKDISEADAKKLWEWLRFQAEQRQRPYAP